jgi:polyhydroxyalkanoate synthase subunit PhaC
VSVDWFRMVDQSIREVYMKSFKDMVTLAGPIPEIPKINIESLDYDVIFSDGRVKLLHYKPLVKALLPIPLLVVYAQINRYYILDLQSDKSVIKHYLERGIDVYIVDWGDPGPEDRYETIFDQIEYVDEVVEVVRKRTHAQKINLQGYCMGGTYSAIYCAVYPHKINSLILQAAPIDFKTQSGILNIWAKYIDADRVVDCYGNVPSSLLNLGFLMIDPVRLLIDKYVKFYENLKDKEFVTNFLRMEKWIFDSPDLPGEVYRQFIKDLYQQNLLSKNELILEGNRIDLRKIRIPLLNIVGSSDTLVPPDSSLPIMDLVSSTDKEVMEFGSGHIGISVSSKAHRELWPKVAEWIEERSSLTMKSSDKEKRSGNKGNSKKSC